MGINKKYDGYKSFQYLDKEDYKNFVLCKELDRVPEYKIDLTDEEEARLLEIARDNILIALHEHPIIYPEDNNEILPYIREGRGFTAYEALSKTYLDVIFDNLMDGTSLITSNHGWKWTDIIHDFGMRMCDISKQNFIIKCEKVEDMYRAHREGKLALVPTFEAATMIENELDRIEILYGFGARMMGITYSESNALGSGLKERKDGGLTYFGRAAVDRMNKVGMAIDTSHCGDQTTLDVIEASRKPVFITHAGARVLWNSNRLKPDDVLKACAAKGGVIGIEAAPHTTISEKNPLHNIDSFMEHFEYIKDLVGIDFVSFGVDSLYGDHVGLHHAFADALSIKAMGSYGNKDFTEVKYVEGLENPTEANNNILKWLIKHNYSNEDIAKVMGGNVIRVLKECWD